MPAKEPRSKPQYILQTEPSVLNKEFYESYDENFLLNKANTLLLLAQHREEFTGFVASIAGQDVDLDDAYFAGLRAEVHFTEIHQMEALFALLLAPFQTLPHRIWLNDYKPGDIPRAVRKFVRFDVSALTNGALKTQQEFVIGAVYNGYATFSDDDEVSKQNWEKSLDDVVWMLSHIGNKYLDASEYNAYKHGLRVLAPGPAWFRLTLQGGSGPGIVRSSEDSLRFLEVEKLDTGDLVLWDKLKLFSLKECASNLGFMRSLLATIKATRLAEYGGPWPESIFQFSDLDRSAAIQAAANNSSSSRRV